ncbi:MAG: hypothetical protein AB1798_09850 [Spirochaetota bacterium]
MTSLKTFNGLLLGAAGEKPDKQAEFLLDCQAEINRISLHGGA